MKEWTNEPINKSTIQTTRDVKNEFNIPTHNG